MRYCCEKLKKMCESVVYESPIEYSYEDGLLGFKKGKWYIMTEIDMPVEACGYVEIVYCPFCGAKLEEKKDEVG